MAPLWTLCILLFLSLSHAYYYDLQHEPDVDVTIGLDPAVFMLNDSIYIYAQSKQTRAGSTMVIEANNKSALSIETSGDDKSDYMSHTIAFPFNETTGLLLNCALTSFFYSNETPRFDLTYYNPVTSEMQKYNTHNPFMSLPEGRYYPQAILSQDKKSVYVFGGALNHGNYSTVLEILKIDVATFNVTSFETFSFLAGSATMLPSGVVVLAFGSGLTDRVYLFDTKTDNLTLQAVDGLAPLPRSFVTGTLGTQSAVRMPKDPNENPNKWVGSPMKNMGFVVLNTSSWAWTYPKVTGPPPLNRLGGFSLLYVDNTIVFGGGATDFKELDEINVLRNLPLPGESLDDAHLEWFTNSKYDETYNLPRDDDDNAPHVLPHGVIAGIAVGITVIIIAVFYVLWRKVPIVRRVLYTIHYKVIWLPRLGEPFWTEAARLVLRFILLAIMVAFLVYVIIRGINSPSIYQVDNRPVTDMPLPDVRICSRPPPTKSPGQLDIRCALSNGTDCSEYIASDEYGLVKVLHKLDDGNYYSWCYHFFTPKKLYFRDTTQHDPNIYSDSLIFRLYNHDSLDMYSSFYITYYPSDHNPNRQYFLYDDTSFSSEDIQNWLKKEDVDHVLENTVNIPMNNYATIRYTLSKTSTLTNSPWNKIGFAYQYNTKPEIALDVGTTVTTFKAMEQKDPLLEILVRPTEFQINATKEQKVSTIIAGLAQVGGVFSLVVAIQVLLFGYRPSSPWGVVHRWSFGRLRQSLTNKLTSEFDPLHTPVPLVTQVQSNEDESDKTRIKQMEERIQLMENLFKTYYIDDEVFRHLEGTKKEDDDNDNDDDSDKTNEHIPLTQVLQSRRDSGNIV